MSKFVMVMCLLALVVGGVWLAGCSDSDSAGSVTLHLYGRTPGTIPTSAEWAAFQDGDGQWRRITPSSTGVYTQGVADGQGRYGFALYDNGDLHLLQGTLEEGATIAYFLDNGLSFSRGRDAAPDETRAMEGYYTINGSITYSFPVTDTMAMMRRGSSASAPIANYGFNVQAGRHDLAISDNTWGTLRTMNWLYLERGIDVQSNMTHNVNVTSSNIITLEDGGSLTVTGDITDGSAYVRYVTANGTAAFLASTETVSSPLSFRGVPASAMVSGDCYEVHVNTDYASSVTACFDSPVGMVVNPPTEYFDTFSSTTALSADETVRFPVFQGLDYPDQRAYFIYGSTNEHSVASVISAGWLEANNTTSYQFPDLRNVDGWQVAWSIAAGEAITYTNAVCFCGSAPLRSCVGHYFSPAYFPLAPGEWAGYAWDYNEG